MVSMIAMVHVPVTASWFDMTVTQHGSDIVIDHTNSLFGDGKAEDVDGTITLHVSNNSIYILFTWNVQSASVQNSNIQGSSLP